MGYANSTWLLTRLHPQGSNGTPAARLTDYFMRPLKSIKNRVFKGCLGVIKFRGEGMVNGILKTMMFKYTPSSYTTSCAYSSPNFPTIVKRVVSTGL